MYLDDGIGGSCSFQRTTEICENMMRDITSAGLTVNLEKSKLKPCKYGTWLGFEIDSKNMMFYVPTEKINSVLSQIDKVLKFETATAREIAKIAGHIA